MKKNDRSMEDDYCAKISDENTTNSKLSKSEFSSMEMRKKREEELEILAKEFAANKVSAAGVSYIISSPSIIRRTLWFIAVMACITFMGYMTVKVIMEYLKYPKVLIKEDVIMYKLPFPGVTICTLNPISNRYVSETSLKKLLDLKNMMLNISTETPNITYHSTCLKKPLCEWSWFQEECFCVKNPCLTEFCMPENSTHCSCLSSFCDNKYKKIKGCTSVSTTTLDGTKEACLCQGVSGQGKRKSSRKDKEKFRDVLSKLKDKNVKQLIRTIKHAETHDLTDIEEALMPTTDELYQYGATFDSLVASCSFEGTRCYRENFTVLYDPTYGKCYMFNYVGTNVSGSDEPIMINSYGSNSGLQLLLRITGRNIVDLLRREIGARISIHDPHTLPFVDEYGMNVRPKLMTNIELSYSKIQRLKKPWGNCDDDARRMYNGDPYSVLGCEKYCGFQLMTRKCNCTMRYFLRGTVLNQLRPPYPICDINDDAQKECVSSVWEEYDSMPICDCRSPCSQTVYEYDVTSSELNVNYFKKVKAIRTLSVDEDGELKYLNYTDQKLMVGVKIYYNTFEVTSHIEVPSYSWETLMANIGGNLGFFMGLTLVTFLEIVEFIWDFLRTACRRLASERKVPKLSTL
ncbi:degenerin-like protein unc-105 [Nephila pilipes]|uniref:Degenerin-like protein unc-105 n=1 Tax=Nephila pilipes TaxID=299642 RepID=A0A8X6QFX6_NEPPI|nr:degenerin-like protein unc-105 [Nephila pilipes]